MNSNPIIFELDLELERNIQKRKEKAELKKKIILSRRTSMHKG